MAGINYHDRYFVTVENNEEGEFTADTILHYRQQGDVVWATYEGGGVLFGTIVAKSRCGWVFGDAISTRK